MKIMTAFFKKPQMTAAVLFLTLLLHSCTKEVFNSGITKEFVLRADLYGASYSIKVGLPDSYNPAEKYATIYVLDGKEIFGFVANKCKEISGTYNKKNVLVVSIGYGRDRSIDYTPTKMSSVTGGAPQFLQFIETQLIPKMEQDFNADTTRESRVILGHSYGGLFGAYAFAINGKVFGNYIILSPSLWFDKYVMLDMEEENRINNKYKKQLVFMGIGENEEKDRMLAPFETFYQVLQNNYSNITLSKYSESNAGHMPSRNPNIVKGLNFYFQNR
ncbi:alpha/beta hydrolase [Pollutibacter soli]|uniref:alpha/beta hydrolase n=1 Tax=Pollutibacter soli TaxID=3034157 RepID=UPI0030132D6C